MLSKHNSAKASLAESLRRSKLADALIQEALSAEDVLVPEELFLLGLEVDGPLLC